MVSNNKLRFDSETALIYGAWSRAQGNCYNVLGLTGSYRSEWHIHEHT